MCSLRAQSGSRVGVGGGVNCTYIGKGSALAGAQTPLLHIIFSLEQRKTLYRAVLRGDSNRAALCLINNNSLENVTQTLTLFGNPA